MCMGKLRAQQRQLKLARQRNARLCRRNATLKGLLKNLKDRFSLSDVAAESIEVVFNIFINITIPNFHAGSWYGRYAKTNHLISLM